MCLQVGGVDHNSFRFPPFASRVGHYPGENAVVAPPFPTIVRRLARAMGNGSASSTKAAAIDEDNPAKACRSSTRGMPQSVGKPGSRRATFAFVSQKRSDMFTARFRTANHANSRNSMDPELTSEPLQFAGMCSAFDRLTSLKAPFEPLSDNTGRQRDTAPGIPALQTLKGVGDIFSLTGWTCCSGKLDSH